MVRQLFVDESGAFDGDVPCVAGGPVLSLPGPNRAAWVAEIVGIAPHVPWPPHSAHLARVAFHVWSLTAGPRRDRALPADRGAFLPLQGRARALVPWLDRRSVPTVAQVSELERLLVFEPGFHEARRRALDVQEAVRRVAVAAVAESGGQLAAAVRLHPALNLAPAQRWATLVARVGEAATWPILRPSRRYPEDHAALQALNLPCEVAKPQPFDEDAHPAFVAADFLVHQVWRVAKRGRSSLAADVARRVGVAVDVVFEEGP